MNRVDYQNLRFSVEAEIDSLNCDSSSSRNVVNAIMQAFITGLAKEEVARKRASRQFLTFRRDKQVTVPGCAFHPTGRN